MSIGIDKLAHINNPALSDILLAHSAAEGTGVIAIGDLPKLLNAGNLKMPDSDETIAEHYKQFCNRNLLDNWYFANSVNQKGQDEYSGGYGIDRWKSDGATVLNDGSVVFSSNFYQKVPVEEFKKRFLGKQLTLSALYTDGTLEFGTLTVPTQYPSSNQILFATPAGLAVALTTDGGPQIFRRQYTNKGVVAVKTEFGSHQTLAHKEGSKWVLNEIPDYTTELKKCQRYQAVFILTTWSNFPASGATGITKNGLRVAFTIPANMRRNPTVSFEGEIYADFLKSGKIENALIKSCVWSILDTPVSVRLALDATPTDTVYPVISISTKDSAAKIILDANL